MDKGLVAAIRRFPLKGQKIRRLALADGSFLSACYDLADAEAALNRLATSSSFPHRDSRLDEYEILVNELAGEIENILNRP
jgi:hypothetical protein